MKTKWIWFVLFLNCLSIEGKEKFARADCRDARTRPFLSTSIWNTAIGSNAIFHYPGIFRLPYPFPDSFFADTEYFIVTSENDPWTPWYNQGWWNNPSGEAHCNVTGKFVDNIRFPFNVTIRAFGNNNVAAFLLPDNHSIINTHPVYRCTPGSPVLSLLERGIEGNDDIVYGNGTWGAYGGSGLSSIGGTIRLGELLPDSPPIQHALKMQLFAKDYYYDQRPGFIWPALRCDGYAFNPNDSYRYGGQDKYLSPGSLFAIPSNSTVNLTTVPAKKLLSALQNYGAYLVADTYRNRGTFNAEHGVLDEFQAAYGYAFDTVSTGPGAAWFADLVNLFQALHIVINNSENTIGGGGIPLQPPQPPPCPPISFSHES